MNIRQARTSAALSFFEPQLLLKYGLSAYASRTEPALFFGCYGKEDLRAIHRHRGFRIVLWGGSDAMDPERIRALRGLRHCYHIAISGFIEQDLIAQGVPSVRLPICPTVHGDDFSPCPKGPALYFYTSVHKPAFYGEASLAPLRERFPGVEIITCTATSYSQAELIGVYRRCFLGLRLVPHDGLSNTVIELGLMGRKAVHNGGLPGSLPFSSFDDICRHIERELAGVGTTDVALSEATRRYLELPLDWLTTDYFLRHVGPDQSRVRQSWVRRLFAGWRSH